MKIMDHSAEAYDMRAFEDFKASACNQFRIGNPWAIQSFDGGRCFFAWQHGIVWPIHERYAQQFARSSNHTKVRAILSGMIVAKI